MSGPIHDRARILHEHGLLPRPIRVYPPTFSEAQDALIDRIRARDRELAAKHPGRRLTQLELDRSDLLYLLSSLLGRIERERWMVDRPTDTAPTRTPQESSPSTQAPLTGR